MSRWSARLREGWAQRTPRERVMLGLMTLALLAFLGWYAVYTPLRQLRAQAQARYDAQARTLLLLQAARAAPLAPARWREAVVSAAARAGVGELRRLDRADGGLDVELPAAPPGSALAWLDTLQRRHALVPQRLQIVRHHDRLRVQVQFAPPP